MLRFAAGIGAALLLVLAGFFYWQGLAQRDSALPPAPPGQTVAETPPGADYAEEEEASGDGAAPAARSRPRGAPPAADARTKEQRRFDRADKDKNGGVTLLELFEPRRRAFARLDTNGDGRLAFEEWAVRTSTKFGEADRDRSGVLTREEYATTAPRRRAPARPAACNC